MNEIKINEMNNQLPNWDLSEIYKDIKDPNIAKDIKEIKALSDDFLTKWKGKIDKLAASDFVNCIEKYQAINEAIYQAMKSDRKVVCFGLGVTDPRRVFYSTEKLVEKFGNERVFDIPTSENALTGVGIGLANLGSKVIYLTLPCLV